MTLREKLREWWENEDLPIILLTLLMLLFILVSITIFAAIAITAANPQEIRLAWLNRFISGLTNWDWS